MVEQGQRVAECLAFVGHVLTKAEIAVENLLVEEVCANASSLLQEWSQSIFLWPDSGLLIFFFKNLNELKCEIKA